MGICLYTKSNKNLQAEKTQQASSRIERETSAGDPHPHRTGRTPGPAACLEIMANLVIVTFEFHLGVLLQDCRELPPNAVNTGTPPRLRSYPC